MPMTTRCSFLLAWTVVAALGAATLGSGFAEAGDFGSFGFSRYVPSSIRSKIEGYLDDKAPAAKPKHDKAVGASSPVVPESGKPVASSTVTTPLVPAENGCLSKQHLATGVVLFKDGCTKEWAINSTSVAGQRVDGKCLTKVRHPDGVVMFRDICTGEWAMNTTGLPRQQTEPPG
jgi:hypothetical protein